jgi:hypothetical protein
MWQQHSKANGCTPPQMTQWEHLNQQGPAQSPRQNQINKCRLCTFQSQQVSQPNEARPESKQAMENSKYLRARPEAPHLQRHTGHKQQKIPGSEKR